MPRTAEPFDFSDDAPVRQPRRSVGRGAGWLMGVAGGLLVALLFVGLGALALSAVWQSSGHSIPPSDMPLRTWLATGAKRQAHFRITAELRSSSDDADWSVRLRDHESATTVIGIVGKDSPDGRRLFELLKDGQEHEVGVRLESVSPDKPATEVSQAARIAKFEEAGR